MRPQAQQEAEYAWECLQKEMQKLLADVLDTPSLGGSAGPGASTGALLKLPFASNKEAQGTSKPRSLLTNFPFQLVLVRSKNTLRNTLLADQLVSAWCRADGRHVGGQPVLLL